MSRDQENQVVNTAQTQNATEFANSQASDKAAEGTIVTQLATNPYTPGGDFDTTTRRQLSNTADAASDATTEQLQQLAQRTGQNRQSGNAAAVAAAQANERALSGQEAQATQQREAGDVGLQAGVEGEEASLGAQQGAEAGGTLDTDQKASQQPSFWDTFGTAAAGALGKGVVTGFAP